MNEIEYFISKIPKDNSRYVFEPFRITFQLGSPIALNHPWMHFDSLIFHVLLKRWLGQDYYILPPKFPLGRALKGNELAYLPIKKTDGLYHASVSILEPYKIQLARIYKRFETRWTDGIKKKKVYRGSGFFKDYAIAEPYIPAKTCMFYINGDINVISDVLNDVISLGNDTRIGWGKILEYNIEKTDKDCSIVKDGKAMRPIPVWLCKEFGDQVPLAWRSPYWAPENVALCCPPFERCVLQ